MQYVGIYNTEKSPLPEKLLFYNLGEGPCESCKFHEPLSAESFVSFISSVSFPSPSNKECYNPQETTTQH